MRRNLEFNAKSCRCGGKSSTIFRRGRLHALAENGGREMEAGI
jgi:hypothetical protein